MIEIVPAVIPPNLNLVKERFFKVLGLVKRVQMDIIDGQYAPTKTWPFNGNQFEEMIRMTRGENVFPFVNEFILEIDMLVLHPIEYLSDFISIGAKSFIIHIESTDHMKECIDTIKNAGCEVGIGIKPSTDISLLEEYLDKIDFIQFMGNDKIGYNGVNLDDKVLDKIKDFNLNHPSITIQIDIGVNENTISLLKKVGVSRFVSGSVIFNSPDIAETLRKIRSD